MRSYLKDYDKEFGILDSWDFGLDKLNPRDIYYAQGTESLSGSLAQILGSELKNN